MSVYSKVALIIRELGSITKDGENRFQGYNYVSAEAFLAHVRQPMAKHGLVCLPSLSSVEIIDGIYIVKFEFSLIDIDEPDNVVIQQWVHTIPVEAKGSKGNYTDDKAIGKAVTYAHRYFLMKLFLVTDQADELDAVNSPETYPSKQTSQAQPPQPPQAQAQQPDGVSAKGLLWDALRTNKALLKRYEHSAHLANALKLYEGDVVADGFDKVFQWLMHRDMSSKKAS